jgi:hypothetical protein
MRLWSTTRTESPRGVGTWCRIQPVVAYILCFYRDSTSIQVSTECIGYLLLGCAGMCVEGYGRIAERYFKQCCVCMMSNKHRVILNCSDGNGDID